MLALTDEVIEQPATSNLGRQQPTSGPSSRIGVSQISWSPTWSRQARTSTSAGAWHG